MVTEVEPSTFTHLARSDRAVKYASELQGVAPIRRVLDLGSSAISPFTILSLPGFENTTLVAVDSSPEVVVLMEEIKKGKKVPWDKIAAVCSNEGRPNQDLLLQDRIQAGLKRLDDLGALKNLGSNFDKDGMQVDLNISSRVTIVESDALEFLAKNKEQQYDMIGAFFLLLNINRIHKDNEMSQMIIRKSLNMLSDQGVLLLGDVNENLPITLRQFANASTLGNLNLLSLAHLGNWGNRVVTSHYIMASQMKTLSEHNELTSLASQNLALEFNLIVDCRNYTTSELSKKSERHLCLAFVGESLNRGQGFFSSAETSVALNQIVPNKNDQKSMHIIFPAQK